MIMANHAQSNAPALAAVLVFAGIATYGQAPQTERHLSNVTQLTSGGENAEAYFSPDGKQLIFQTNPGTPDTCDQIFTMNVDGSNKKQLSKGGRTTCGYFFPDGKSIIYASTHLGSAACPPRPSFSRGYVWPVYPELRHLPIVPRRVERQAPDEHPRLRRGSDDWT